MAKNFIVGCITCIQTKVNLPELHCTKNMQSQFIINLVISRTITMISNCFLFSSKRYTIHRKLQVPNNTLEYSQFSKPCGVFAAKHEDARHYKLSVSLA